MKWVFGLTVCLLLGSLAVGTYFWLRPSTSIPEIPLKGQEKAVADAATTARAAVANAPRSADAWGHLGRVLLANEIHPDIAFICFLEAERLDPNNPRWPYFCAGYLSVDLGKPEEALPKLRRAVSLAEKDSNGPSAPRLMLAETLLAVGQTDEAELHFMHVLEAEPKNPRPQFGLGLVALSRGEWLDCRKYFEACLSSPRARKKACAHLIAVCERMKDRQGAEDYTKRFAGFPQDFGWQEPYVDEHQDLAVRNRVLYRMVEYLESQGKYDQAANILVRLIGDNPDDYRPRIMMGRILPLTSKGELQSAENHLLKARQLAPDKVQVHYLLSLVLYRKGDALLAKGGDPLAAKTVFEESAKSARQALAIRPDYGFAHMSLGLALKQLGRRADALAAFRQAVECSPEYADNHLYLGEALAAEGDVAAARRHLEQAQLLAHPEDRRPKAALDKLR